MNCDQVFDVLTRGPFPAGEPSDEAVEWHLAGCDNCGRLAEALRPAVELLHEAIVDDETASLPGYSGRLAFEEMPWNDVCNNDGGSGEAGRLTTQRLAIQNRPIQNRAIQNRAMLRRAVLGGGKAQRFWRFAAAVALGAMLALGLGAMGLPDGKDTLPGAQGPLSPNSHGLGQLVALNLPGVCFEARSDAVGTMNVDAVMTAPVDRRNFQCCARCHAEGRARVVSIETTSKVVRSCQVCHSS